MTDHRSDAGAAALRASLAAGCGTGQIQAPEGFPGPGGVEADPSPRTVSLSFS